MNLNTEQYFSTVPEIHAPRSVFDRSFTYKTTMNVNKLYPIFVDEALPGDSFRLHFQVFGRLINPLTVPIMDELYFETLWFKIPNRLVWSHWVNFCGEQENPDDSVDYVLPTINSGENGFAVGSLADYFGIPVGVANLDVNSLPFRAYNLVYNQWFRDENLINSVTVPMTDSDDLSNYSLLTSAKVHDYFTSCLPFAQKGDPVMLPLGDYAPVYGNGKRLPVAYNNKLCHLGIGATGGNGVNSPFSGIAYVEYDGTGSTTPESVTGRSAVYYPTQSMLENAGLSGPDAPLKADLSQAVGASIADFRFAIKLQQKRERDARGGTRYIEWIKSHFNVDSPDARLQRTEFLGSTREIVDVNTVIQTSASDANSTPQGNISGYGVIDRHQAGFSTSFTEHSYVLGIARIRHNPIYQQGLNAMWSRSTLLDFYLPIFNGLSEQPVLNKEIYAQGGSVLDATTGQAVDDMAFGFNEAWAPYRFKPSMITGMLRSGITGSLDVFHLAQSFSQLPVLNQSFIEENIPMDRVIAVQTSETTPQFVFDFRFIYECARPMPVRNIPAGLYDRF